MKILFPRMPCSIPFCRRMSKKTARSRKSSRRGSIVQRSRVVRMVDSSEFKRRQAPIGVKITHRAFGKDRRMPITNGYRN